MSLPPPPSEQTDDAGTPPHDAEVSVDVAAFLPDGVELAAADEPTVAPAPEGAVDVAALDQLERDLDAVDAAIARLDDGTYGLDPASGEPIDDALLAEDPTRRS